MSKTTLAQRNINTYLFDFDGTLVDSMPTYIGAMLKILDDQNIQYDDDIVKTITPLGVLGTANYFINELGVGLELEPLIDLMKKYMVDAYFNHIPAKSNVIEVLSILKNQGASLNVLTASPHITLDACLKRLQLWDLFDNVWSCDDFYTTKADPNIYRLAAQRLGKPIENVLFLDDNLDADTTARSAGMTVCGVHDPSSEEYKQQIQTVTDYYIYDFAELLKL